jgi:hypothetical protein
VKTSRKKEGSPSRDKALSNHYQEMRRSVLDKALSPAFMVQLSCNHLTGSKKFKKNPSKMKIKIKVIPAIQMIIQSKIVRGRIA